MKETLNPLKEQVGGDHYKKYPIQPIQYFCEMWGGQFCAASITKYIMRYKDKNGVEDLKKARHVCDLALTIMGAWTGQHNLDAREQAIFNTFIEVNGLQSMKITLQMAAQYDFAGCGRKIDNMIEMEKGEVR